MTGPTVLRRNIEVLTWLRAAAFVAVTAVALATMPALPVPVTAAVAVAVGALALFSPPAAVIASVLSAALVVGAANITVGILVALGGIAAGPWLSRNGALRFFLVFTPALLALGHAEWAPVAVAGFMLASGEGAITAAIACLVLEAVGFAVGRPVLGAEATGGAVSLVHGFTGGAVPAVLPNSFLAQIRAFDSAAFVVALTQVRNVGLLLVQPALWGLGALIASRVATPLKQGGRRRTAGVAASAAGVGTVAAATAGFGLLLRSPTPSWTVLATAALSFAAATVWLLTWETLFAHIPAASTPAAAADPGPAPLALSPIDQLMTQLAAADARPGVTTSDTVVVVAEALPPPAEGAPDPLADVAAVLEERGARGTTGRGALIAAFDDPAEAVRAAADAQHARLRADSGDMTLQSGARIAVARGQARLDRLRRPVGGEAVGLAAAICTMTGPGQVLATAETVAAAPGTRTTALGPGAPPGMDRTVELVAVRWADPAQHAASAAASGRAATDAP